MWEKRIQQKAGKKGDYVLKTDIFYLFNSVII